MASGTSPRQAGLWYHGWNIVAVCIVSQMVSNGLTFQSYTLFLRGWKDELHTPISTLQLSLAMMGIACAIVSPIIGNLADKLPARRLLALGSLVLAGFWIGVSFATAAWQILALYALLGPIALCLSASIPCNAVISRWFVRHRGLAIGLSALGIGMAGVIVPPVVAAILPTLGWRMVWRGAGLLVALVVVPLVLFVVRDRPTEREGLDYVAGEAAAAGAHHGHGGGASSLSWRQVLSRPNFWLILAAFLPILGIQGAFLQNAAPYVASHGLGPQYAGLIISVASIAQVIASFAFGPIADRFGNRTPLAVLCMIVTAGVLVLAFATGLPTITAGIILLGLGGGVMTLLATALAAEFGAEGIGRAFGLAMLFLPLVAPSSPVIAKTQEVTGSYAPAFLGFAALTFLGGVLVLLMRERRGGHLTKAEQEAAFEEAAQASHTAPPVATHPAQ